MVFVCYTLQLLYKESINEQNLLLLKQQLILSILHKKIQTNKILNKCIPSLVSKPNIAGTEMGIDFQCQHRKLKRFL